MGNVAVPIVTILAFVTVTFGAGFPERPGTDDPRFTRPEADMNVSCILGHDCTLPCSFQGEFQEAYWRREDSQVPIILKPPEPLSLHHDYKDIVSMPVGGAALLIRGVQLKHQGLHRCSVTSSTGKIDLFIYLSVHDEEETLCVYMKSCVLPCRFTPGSDLYIRWTKTERDLMVHSFHQGQNRVLVQYLEYRGRTSLFEEEKITGNASLLLKDVTVKDEGRYLCLANGQYTYVNMTVYAPVSEVNVSSVGDLYCQAHDIYPKPSLKWTRNPESSTDPQVSVNRSDTGLFSVNSSVPRPDPPYEYTCTVSTEHSTNSTTYKETAPKNHNLHYLWILAVIVAAVVCFLIYYCHKLKKKHISLPNTPPTSRDEEPGSSVPLKSGGNSESQPPTENGHTNGHTNCLDKETSM